MKSQISNLKSQIPADRPAPARGLPRDTFELILDHFGPQAILLPEPIPVARLKQLYDLVASQRGTYELKIDLARRWNLWGVITHAAWEKIQLAREPMLKPKGLRLAFLD